MNENDQENEVIDDRSLDQTRFAEEALILPTDRVKAAVAASPSRRRSPLLILLIAVPVMFGLFVVTLMYNRGREQQQAGTPSPSPLAVVGSTSEIDRRFDQLSGEIKAADPTSFTLAFPPIDFALDLPDASELQLRRRR